MNPLPIPEWSAALDEMDVALAATFAALDRYQIGWHGLLSEPVPTTGPPAGGDVLARLEDRLKEWDARLAAAEQLAALVERQLDAREAAVGRWRDMFSGWQEVIKQGVEPRTAS
jgi:hypothetical protein